MGMRELVIKGTKPINEKEVKIIEGGFGENQKCILASDIAIQHDVELFNINKLINNNISRFGSNDIIDFLNSSEEFRNFAKENGLITSNRTKNIYLLSERGYTKLVAMMDNTNEKKWEVMDKLIDEYFTMRKQIKQLQLSKKQELQLTILNGGDLEKVTALATYEKLVVKEATQPLLNKIEEDKPLVTFAERIIKDGDNILIRELAKIISDQGLNIGERKLYSKLREWGYIFKNSTEPTQRVVDNGYFVVITKVINTPYGTKETFTTKVTPKGQVKIVERILKDNKIDNT